MRREIQELMLHVRFDEVLTLAQEGASRATIAGDHGLWRRFGCDEATALFHLGRLEDSLARADAVVADAERDGVPEDMARAWNVSAIAADRLGRQNDALTRLDAALAVGEQLHRDAARLDVLGKAACSAASIGFAELGDAVFEEVLADVAAGEVGELAPSTMLWLVGQHIVVRIWLGLIEEHAGRPGAAPKHFEGAIELCRTVLAWPGLPAVPTASVQGMYGFLLTALERHGEAAAPLAAARTVLPAEPFQIYTGGVEVTTGLSRLRADPPRELDALHAAGRRQISYTRRCLDVRAEAESWLRWGIAAERLGDDLQAQVNRERFEALVERLDWRARLDEASLLSFRSTTLSRVARGGTWRSG